MKPLNYLIIYLIVGSLLSLFTVLVYAWPVLDGVAICTASGNQVLQAMVSDGDSGAIIIWEENPNLCPTIYAQRVNRFGSIVWHPNGITISTSIVPATTAYPKAISDNSGGAIIVWDDHRNGSDIYAQRVNSLGSTLWALNGVAVCTGSTFQSLPELVSDDSSGAIICWLDYIATSDIYAQQINSFGQKLWAENGISVCTAPVVQQNVQMVTDYSGGAILT